jgi:hypothetical protein
MYQNPLPSDTPSPAFGAGPRPSHKSGNTSHSISPNPPHSLPSDSPSPALGAGPGAGEALFAALTNGANKNIATTMNTIILFIFDLLDLRSGAIRFKTTRYDCIGNPFKGIVKINIDFKSKECVFAKTAARLTSGRHK